MTKSETGRLLRAPRTMLEAMQRHVSHGMMRRIRKGHGGNLMPGPLNCRAEADPVHLSEIVDTLRHPALPQSEIAAKFFSGAVIGLRQSPDPAGQKLIVTGWRSKR